MRGLRHEVVCAAVRAAVLAVFWAGGAVAAQAASYGSKAQDLLLRWAPPEEEPGLVLHIVFALALAVAAAFAFRAWRHLNIGVLVASAACSAVFAAGWVFGPELAREWARMEPAPWWAR